MRRSTTPSRGQRRTGTLGSRVPCVAPRGTQGAGSERMPSHGLRSVRPRFRFARTSATRVAVGPGAAASWPRCPRPCPWRSRSWTSSRGIVVVTVVAPRRLMSWRSPRWTWCRRRRPRSSSSSSRPRSSWRRTRLRAPWTATTTTSSAATAATRGTSSVASRRRVRRASWRRTPRGTSSRAPFRRATACCLRVRP